MPRRMWIVVAVVVAAHGNASAGPASEPDAAAGGPWSVAATVGAFAMWTSRPEEDYVGPRLGLEGGYRAARPLTLVGRLGWTRFQDLHDDPDPVDAGVELIETADRVSLGPALRVHAGEHVWFETAACPEIVFYRVRNNGGSGRDSAVYVGLDVSVAVGIELLPGRVLGPYVEGRAGWQLGEPPGPQVSAAIGLRWR